MADEKRSLKKTGWVANRIGFTPDGVRKLAQEGKIPSMKVGFSWRYDETAIEQWIANGGTKQT